MLAHPGNRLLLHTDQGYTVARDERIVTLGTRQEESAALVLRTMLAEAPVGETIEVNWLTSAQHWAIRVVVEAGIELVPYGPVMVRGMDRAALALHPERRVRLGPPERPDATSVSQSPGEALHRPVRRTAAGRHPSPRASRRRRACASQPSP